MVKSFYDISDCRTHEYIEGLARFILVDEVFYSRVTLQIICECYAEMDSSTSFVKHYCTRN